MSRFDKVPVLRLKKLSPYAVLPEFGYEGDAFPDMVAVKEVVLWPGSPVKVPLGVASEMDPDYYIEVRPKSGLASEGIMVANAPGTIDSNYRGEWMAVLVNVSNSARKIDLQEKVVQIALKRKTAFEVEVVDELSETSRGTGGFSSTGRFTKGLG